MGKKILKADQEEFFKQEVVKIHRDTQDMWKKQFASAKEAGRILMILKASMNPAKYRAWVKETFKGNEDAADTYVLLISASPNSDDLRAWSAQRIGWNRHVLRDLLDALQEASQEGKQERTRGKRR